MSDNAIHDAEHDEWRSAVADMSELERVQSCGHYWSKGHCIYCGEEADA